MQLIYRAHGPDAKPAPERPPEVAAGLLANLYAYPDPPQVSREAGRPWVRANMIASVDGAAELAGLTSGLGGPTDRLLFQVLRALADVILVGGGTARAEGYGPARPATTLPAATVRALRSGRPATPPIAVVSSSLNLDPNSSLIARAPQDARTILLTSRSAPADQRAVLARHAEVIVAGEDRVSIGEAVAVLAARGHHRILTEGGPRLLAQLAAEDVLDDLCLTVSPVLAGGDARRILAGGPSGQHAAPGLPATLSLAHVVADNGYLFCRYVRPPA